MNPQEQVQGERKRRRKFWLSCVADHERMMAWAMDRGYIELAAGALEGIIECTENAEVYANA